MKLTPLDIHHKEFRNSLRGYSPEEVDDFLDEVADEFERMFKENIDLNEKLEASAARVRAYSDMERTLQNTMVAAQVSADDMRARAEADAGRMISEAESKAQTIVSAALEDKQRSQNEYTRLKAAEDQFRGSFRRMLEDYLGAIVELEPGSAVAVSEPVTVAEPESVAVAEPEPAAAVEPEPEPAAAGTVSSLFLGEDSAPELAESDVPTLELPEEFAMPRGPIGERDEDNDIEEID
jgi:cell division initiation protein